MPELDLGNVKGPQGKSAYQSALDAGYSGSEEAFNTAMAKAPDAVLYTPQNLTDEQKAQARGNINAAPGGFGLGGAAKWLTSNDDLNDIWQSGNYAWGHASVPKNAPNTGLLADVFLMHVWGYNPQGLYQEIVPITDGQTNNSANNNKLVRSRYNTAARAWEWINPPMLLGTEYRTTERYLGKPVYCKVVDCGAVPDANTNKTVDFADPGISRIISWTGNVDVGGNTFALPYQEVGREGGNATIYVFVNYAGITLRTDSRWFAENSGTAQCTIWYTKATD